MLALISAWSGLLVCILAVVMTLYAPAFNDVTIPLDLYGAVLGIGCGGMVLMRRLQPDDDERANAAQKTQAIVGIGLSMCGFFLTYGTMAVARKVTLGH